MKLSRNRTVLVLTILGLFAMSGIALAASSDDTVFNYGYDEGSQFFMWNVTSLEYDPDFEALEDALEAGEDTTSEDFEALLEACGLGAVEGEDPIEYGYTFDGESIQVYELDGAGSFDPEADDPIESVQSGDCGEFTGGFVTGPEGQVNHGMFLKLFNELYDGENRGCLVSQIARSDLGKGDQQVQAGEGDTAETAETVEDGRITFTTVGADCVRGPQQGGEVGGDDDSDRRGPPQFVLDRFGGDKPGKGKPEGTPGGGRP